MKQIAALLVLLIAATAASEESVITAQQKAAMAQAAELRTFTTVDGKEIVGRPVGFKKEAGIVELEMTDDAKCTVALSTLSEKDQVFIQDWHTAYSLLNKRKLRISFEKIREDDCHYYSRNTHKILQAMFPKMRYEDGWQRLRGARQCDEIGYNIHLDNRSGQELTDIKVKYCIYHQAEIENEVKKGAWTPLERGGGGGLSVNTTEELPEQTLLTALIGEFSIHNLLKRDTSTEKTKTIKCIKEVTEYYDEPPAGLRRETWQIIHYGNPIRIKRYERTLDCDILGIRTRVFLPTSDGNYAMMEFAEPKSLLKETVWPVE